MIYILMLISGFLASLIYAHIDLRRKYNELEFRVKVMSGQMKIEKARQVIKLKGIEKGKIAFAQVYRINGRLVVANSHEDAINIWREWMNPNCPAIKSVKRIGNDPTLHVGNEALVFKSGLYEDNVSQFLDNIEEQSRGQVHDRSFRANHATCPLD